MNFSPIDAPNKKAVDSQYEPTLSENKERHKICTDIATPIKDASKDILFGGRIIAESLFESGYLSEGIEDDNTEDLINTIFGVKMANAIPLFETVYDKLKKGNFIISSDGNLETSKLKNPHSDNRYGCLEIEQEADNSAEKFMKEIMGDLYTPDKGNKTELTKVIYIEAQSPSFAVALKYDKYGKPNTFSFIKIKNNFSDECKFKEFFDMKFENIYSHYVTILNCSELKCRYVINHNDINYIISHLKNIF